MPKTSAYLSLIAILSMFIATANALARDGGSSNPLAQRSGANTLAQGRGSVSNSKNVGGLLDTFRSAATPPKTQSSAKFWLGHGDMQLQTIKIADLKREYYLYRPANKKITYPLPTVIALHGHFSSGPGLEKMTGGLSALADREGFLLVYAEGLDHSWNDGKMADLKPPHSDVAFVSQLMDKLIASKLADPKRIYVVGISNGGFMAQYLALKIPDRLAAVATLSGTVAEPYVPLKTGKPVPILLILGTEDTIVPWEGGSLGTLSTSVESFGKLLSGPKSVQFWVDNNHAGKVEHVTKWPDRDPKDETRVTETAYGHGKSEVLFFQMDGGGHTWPGGEQYLPDLVVGPVCHDINANEVIWNFFKRHTL